MWEMRACCTNAASIGSYIGNGFTAAYQSIRGVQLMDMDEANFTSIPAFPLPGPIN